MSSCSCKVSRRRFLRSVSIVLIYLLLAGLRPAVAMDLCDARYNRPDFDVLSPSPDLSHSIFNQSRWRCVTQTVRGAGAESSIKPFTGFAEAVAQCAAATEAAYAPAGSSYEQLLGMADANAAAIAAIGTLQTDVTEEAACVLWSADGFATTNADSYVGQYHFDILGPATWRLYAGDMEGETVRFAALIPWGLSGSDLKSFTVEYTPEHRASRCHDPLCTGGSTEAAQYQYGPIEPGHGTVDLEVPLLAAEFPGLVPLSLHYSSWDVVKKTQGRTMDAIEPNRAPVEEAAIGTYWYQSWHHSYDKWLVEDYRGDGVVAPMSSSGDPAQLYLYLPGEDVLVFEKSGETWASVSHPGVMTRIRSLGPGNGYEAFHPNGYLERYDAAGALQAVHYPNGRALHFTRTIDQQTFQPALKIEQTNPAAGAVVVSGYTGEIRRVSDVNNPDYRFAFEYQESANFLKPQLTAITRPDGTVLNVTQKQVSQQGEQLSIDHGYFLLESLEMDGHRLLTIEYANDGRAKSINYLNGERYEAQYDQSGLIMAAPYGARYSLSTSDQPVGESDYFGRMTMPSLVSADCPMCGYSESYSYDNQGVIAHAERTGTLPFSADYSQGLLNRFAYGTQSVDFQWNPDQQRLTAIDGTEVLSTQMGHDAGGQLVQVQSSRGDKTRNIQVERDNGGRMTKLSSPNNDWLEVGYTGRGFITSLQNRLNLQYQFLDHNHLGQPRRLVGPNGVENQLDYDALGRLTHYQSASGDSLSLTYNALGQPETATSNGRTLDFGYDANQRLTHLDAGACEPRLTYQYDANGLLTRESLSHNGVETTTRYEYGPEGRLQVQTNHYASGAVRADYDERGQVTRVADGDNIRQYHYDEDGRLEHVTAPDGQETAFSFGALGRLGGVTAPGGRATHFDYDLLGQLAGQHNANWGERFYQYGAAHLLARRQTPQYTSTYHYDDGDRPQSVVHRRKDASQPSITVNYQYDGTRFNNGLMNYGVGRLTQVDNGVGRYRYRYNAQGQLIEQGTTIAAGSRTEEAQTHYRYDDRQQLVEIHYPGGDRLRYERAACGGHVTDIYWNGSHLAELDYDTRLHPYTQASLSNGVTVTRQFDDRHRLADIRVERNSGSAPLWARSYDYDSHNNLVAIRPPGGVVGSSEKETFRYDSANRLVEAQGPYGSHHYQYDARHRRAFSTQNGDTVQYRYRDGKDQLAGRYDAAGQLLENYTYDADGHRTRGGDWSYRYDAAGRLAEVYQDGQWVARYGYDANGKRVSKQTAEGSLYFHYDSQGRLLEEVSAQGDPVRQYLYTGDGDLLAVVINNTPYFVHRDQRGAPQRLTGPTGAIAWEATYTPFGTAVVDRGPGVDLPLRLLGQYYDAETGLHYNQQRYYDPDTGQYLGVDPLGLAGGFELYNYARQNPHSYVDPEGEFVFTTAAAVITGVSLALTAWDVYETVDGLASGEVTASDLAGAYGRQKAIDIGLKAIPGIGGAAYLVKKGLKRYKDADDLVTVRHHTNIQGLSGIGADGAIKPGRPAGMDANVGVHVEVNPIKPVKSAPKEVGATYGGAYVDFQVPRSSLVLTHVGPRQTAVVPTKTPMSLKGKNAKFRTTWWRFWE